MSISAQNRNLPDWFTRIRNRQIALPRFQRFEAWNHSYVSQLFNTVLSGLPVGALLTLEIGDKEPFVSRTMVGAPTEGDRVTEHLLDGQQRLTALWRGLHNKYEDRTYFLCVEDEAEFATPYYVKSIARWKKPDEDRYRPFWADDPVEQWKRKLIPLNLCAPEKDTMSEDVAKAYRGWAKAAIPDAGIREDISEIRSRVRNTLATFNLPYLNLPSITEKEVALDVFIKMNTTAAALKTYDIVVAQLEASIGKSLHDLVSAAKEACPEISFYYEVEELILYASALLQKRAPTNQTYLDSEFGPQLVAHWSELIKGIKKASKFLEEEKIFDEKRLPSDIVVPVLTAIWARAPETKDAEGRVRTILRKYMWKAFFSNRYERSTNSRAPQDYAQVKALIDDPASPLPIIFDNQQSQLPEPEELLYAGWPKKKDRLARAILALSLKQGGLDLADASSASRESLTRREYHHLFPVARLEEQGFEDAEIFRSLNCALVTWNTNRTIGAQTPERYLAERSEHAELGEDEIRERLATHIIPFDALKKGSYSDFLKTRASEIHTKMLELCG